MQLPLAVVGLGYVGLPLSLQFAKRGSRVLGLDIDEAKVSKLNEGVSYIHHVPSPTVEAQSGMACSKQASISLGLRSVEQL